MGVLELLLVAAAVPALVGSGYLLLLAVLSVGTGAPPKVAPHLRFDLVVPAHDEEAGISETVRSLCAVDYPPELRRVLVVADNCQDRTAERARAAGAEVLVRNDPVHRGKGYALEAAFARVLQDGAADAVVVVDADTVVSQNLLSAFAAQLEAGAHAVQSRYGVRNPEASWRTRLMAIAFALFNTVRSLGRERLGCSVGLKGNGMCFSAQLLREVPHRAYSIVEDLEYGVRLGLAGRRVAFAGQAEVLGEMVPDAAGSRSQRRRWEEGRREVAREHALVLLRRGVVERDRVLFDLALELLLPPLTVIAVTIACGVAASIALALHAGRFTASLWMWSASAGFLLVYLVRGWWISGTGLKGLTSILHAPVYVVWKMRLALGRREHGRGEWVRTRRPASPAAGPAEPGGRRGGQEP